MYNQTLVFCKLNKLEVNFEYHFGNISIRIISSGLLLFHCLFSFDGSMSIVHLINSRV